MVAGLTLMRRLYRQGRAIAVRMMLQRDDAIRGNN
jgi:hypothetical protein